MNYLGSSFSSGSVDQMSSEGLKRTLLLTPMSPAVIHTADLKKPAKFIPESDKNAPLARRQSTKIAEC